MQKAKNKIYAAVVAVVLLVAAALSLLIPWQKKSASAETAPSVTKGYNGRFVPSLTVDQWVSSTGPISYSALHINMNSLVEAKDPFYSDYVKTDMLLSFDYPFEVSVGYRNDETGLFGIDSYLKITGYRVGGEPYEDVSGFRNGKFESPNMGLSEEGREIELDTPRVSVSVGYDSDTYNENETVFSMNIVLGDEYFDTSKLAQVICKAWFRFVNADGSKARYVQCEYMAVVDRTQSPEAAIGGYRVVEKTDLSDDDRYKRGYEDGLLDGKAMIDESKAYQLGYDKGHHDGKMEAEAAAEPTPIKPASVEEAYKKGYSEGYFVGLEVNNKDSKWYDGYKKGYNDAVNGFTKAEDPEAPEEPAKAWYQTAWEYFVNWIKVYWWVVVIAVAALSMGIALAVRRRRW